VAGAVVAPVVAGLVVGAAFVVLFVLHDFARESTVIIPEGSSVPENGSNFTPQTLTVMVGVNNTVVWVNQDVVPSTVIADNEGDPDFFDATSKPDLLMQGEQFRYKFMRPGEFDYHSEPHPWMRGTVVVLPGR
jgi:plastocyanin